MDKLRKNELGFGVLELLFVVLAMVAIATSGYLIYKHHHKTVASVTNSISKTATVSSSASNAELSDSALILQRQKYIDSFVNASPSTNYKAAYYSPLYKQGYITAALNSQLQANADNYVQNGRPASMEFTCSSLIPSSYSYGTPDIKGNSATLLVNEYFSGYTTSSPLTSVWAKNNGVWQFDVIPPHNCFQ